MGMNVAPTYSTLTVGYMEIKMSSLCDSISGVWLSSAMSEFRSKDTASAEFPQSKQL